MAFTLTATYQLNGYHFVIPSYQRGYRWDKDQVGALLNDLKDFLDSNPNPTTSVDYYLQPIVVAPMYGAVPTIEGKQGIEAYEKETVFEVIDGQQRLTTLYLIHECLNSLLNNIGISVKSFTLSYPNRPTQDTFIQNKGYMQPNSTTYQDNIDTFYMYKAYKFINDWMKDILAKSFTDMSTFVDMLKGGKNYSVKVIWYELNRADAISTFKEINYGRIPLTGTELVKAILLADYGNTSDTYNRAGEWDRMEKSLQDPAFWSMLHQSSTTTSHIDFVLDLVADEFNGKLSQKLSKGRYGLLFNYNVIDTYIRQEERKGRKRTDMVEEIWASLEDNFNRIRNWYDNAQWYNYIGLWTRLSSCTVANIRALESSAHDKDDMTEALRKEVGKTLFSACDMRDDSEIAAGTHCLDSANFSYLNDKAHKKMRLALLAFNVMTFIDHSSAQRFPFHLYDLYDETSLEHIHPQNITFNHKFSEIKESVSKRMANALALTPNELQKAGLTPKGLKEIGDRLNEAFSDAKWDSDKKVNEADPLWVAVSGDVAAIDKIFGDLANIDEAELHSIANMALVNQPTNAALSNLYLDAKRRILHTRNQKRLKRHDDTTVEDGEMYLMPATELAFSKFFTTNGSRQYPLGDMRFWRMEDREEYLHAIKQAFDHLTK